MLKLRAANSRGRAEHGWLSSRHTFSFGSYHDPKEMGFSDLLVINEDRVQAGGGFGMHAHRDMEIFSYVLDGALQHRDSMGTGSVIQRGDVQLMSAGTGIAHSEFNASQQDPVHFLQIWIVPRQAGGPPRYQQTHIDEAAKRGRLCLILSPDGADGALQIRQDTRVYAGLFDGEEHAELLLDNKRYAYIHVARGDVRLNGITLNEGDGARLQDISTLRIDHSHAAEVLIFDLRAGGTSP